MEALNVLRGVFVGASLILALLALRQAASRARDPDLPSRAISWPGLLSYVLLLVGSAVTEYRQIGKPWTWWATPVFAPAVILGFVSIYQTMRLPLVERLRGRADTVDAVR